MFADAGIVHQLLLQRLALAAQVRVVGQPVDQRLDRVAEPGAPGMVRLAHVGEQLDQAAGDLAGDGLVHPAR